MIFGNCSRVLVISMWILPIVFVGCVENNQAMGNRTKKLERLGGYTQDEKPFRVCIYAPLNARAKRLTMTLLRKKDNGLLLERHFEFSKHMNVGNEGEVEGGPNGNEHFLVAIKDEAIHSFNFCEEVGGLGIGLGEYSINFNLDDSTRMANIDFNIESLDSGIDCNLIVDKDFNASMLVVKKIRQTENSVIIERNWEVFSAEECLKYKITNLGDAPIYGTSINFGVTKFGAAFEYDTTIGWQEVFLNVDQCADAQLYMSGVSDVITKGDDKNTICSCPSNIIKYVERNTGSYPITYRYHLDYSYSNEGTLWKEAYERVETGKEKYLSYTLIVHRFYDAVVSRRP